MSQTVANLWMQRQEIASLGICGELILEPTADTKIRGCSSPIVQPLYTDSANLGSEV